MKEIIKLIVKYHFTIIFIILELISVALIVWHNEYQRVVFSRFTSTVFGSISSMATGTKNYFYLGEINRILAEENIVLKNRLEQMEALKDTLQQGSFIRDSSAVYEYVGAKSVNITFNRMQNYISINRGKRDGLEREMAVTTPQGVVGMLQDISDKYSIVIPLINIDLRVSAKIKKNNTVGSVQWDGNDYRYTYMRDVLYNVDVVPGDTIVTSGHTSIFPEGLVIGTVDQIEKENANFLKIRIALAVDFKSISYLYVIRNNEKAERNQLEKAYYE